MPDRHRLLEPAVARFALAGLLAVVALGALILAAVSRVSTAEALSNAKDRARLAGHGIVEPALDASLDRFDAEGDAYRSALDLLVQSRVMSDRVVRVKVWSPDGRILYSDEPKLIGEQFAQKADHAQVLRTGEISAEIASIDGPENRFERETGRLVEVYLPLRLPNGDQVVYEQYEKYDSVIGNSRRLLRRLALPLVAGLLVLWLTQLPLARSLVRRVRTAEAEHAVLLERAITASERERERIAADLHDGVVQDLAGLTFELSATAASASTASQRDALEKSADIARTAMRRLRSSLVDLHPSNVQALGLADALDALAKPLRADGVAVTIDLDGESIEADASSLLYRSAVEVLHNVHEHAKAKTVSVVVETLPEAFQMRITDDGCGFSNATRAERKRAGHVGLDLHQAVIERAGGTFGVTSVVGAGTTVTIEVPR